MASFPTALYAGVLLIATFAYLLLKHVVVAQNELYSAGQLKNANKRDWISAASFVLAIPSAYIHPALSFFLILAGVLLYFLPNASLGI
jgi:uncharacterized membrane protein